MRDYIRHFRTYFFSSIVILSIYIVVRAVILSYYNIEPNEVLLFDKSYIPIVYLFTIIVTSALVATILSVIDVFLLKRILYRKPLLVVFTIAFLINLIVLGLTAFGIDQIVHYYFDNRLKTAEIHPNYQEFFVWIILMVLVIMVSRFIIEIEKKLGYGNLRKLITGKFYKPREEQVIFMFVDLKDSTSIAEKLGMYQYSYLLKDCFSDFSIVDEFSAEIYQYVGDEVVITWPVSEAKNYRKFLQAFFAFKNVLEKKRKVYEEKYGVFPVFKAGAHSGPIIVTEVGDIKRELTYHGDTINTTSRIQDMCNKFDSELLISESLYKIIKPYTEYHCEDVGGILLKGKAHDVRLYKVSE
jgi:adenylate cyclase